MASVRDNMSLIIVPEPVMYFQCHGDVILTPLLEHRGDRRTILHGLTGSLCRGRQMWMCRVACENDSALWRNPILDRVTPKELPINQAFWRDVFTNFFEDRVKSFRGSYQFFRISTERPRLFYRVGVLGA